MKNLVAYKSMPVWTVDTLPSLVTQKHNTKEGTWGKITILSGQLKFYELTEEGQVLAEYIYHVDHQPSLVEPQAWHKIEALTDDLRMQLTFYCEEADYFKKVYQLGRAHSEVIEALIHVPVGRVLDLGCGQGRNALYLAKRGFDVTAVDQNPASLETLVAVAEAEDLDLQIGLYDINQASLKKQYDFILSTVVFMFLQADQIPAIIANMQEKTAPGGYNLIVCAMDTDDAPCTVPFSFTFKENELCTYYDGWDLIKYNEDFGHLHKVDVFGNPIRLRFATMLAKKPEN